MYPGLRVFCFRVFQKKKLGADDGSGSTPMGTRGGGRGFDWQPIEKTFRRSVIRLVELDRVHVILLLIYSFFLLLCV